MRTFLAAVLLVFSLPAIAASPSPHASKPGPNAGVRFESLESLTTDALRNRRFGSTIKIETDLSKGPTAHAYAKRFFASLQPSYSSTMASYDSDGMRLYARIDVPKGPQPLGGYPVIVFMHGWVGYEAAKEFHFSYTPASMYAEMIDAYAKAGFVVVTPGYRGHGTVNGVVADGRASMAAWDNATHVSPVLYAIDVLNLIDGLKGLERIDWRQWGRDSRRLRLNLRRLSIAGHSQGGDVALIVLAVSGRGSQVVNRPQAGSIMSGTFPDRFTQVETFRPMDQTAQAFLAGDGTWTGSATGGDGTINPHFIFAWPSDSIETVKHGEWTWQKQKYARATVREVVEAGYAEMYSRLNEQVDDLRGAKFSILSNASAKGYTVSHDPRVQSVMQRLGAFQRDRMITARLSLHFPDRDYYSLPSWNRDLCDRLVKSGGQCTAYEYPGNTHALRLSKNGWFSPSGSEEAYPIIIQRDLVEFRRGGASAIPPQVHPTTNIFSDSGRKG